MKDKAAWVSITITIIVLLLTFGVTWGTLNSRVNAVEDRTSGIEGEYQTINGKLDTIIKNQTELQTQMKFLMKER
ncbi:hypothetical protein [Shewanella sp.]|jgi:peptidoglycan hydrolase CwlO-like protein|uniref:hypothetical protein n=1 Tax=Shewanella sp. TaxID=50422 RepID=UPI003565B007